MRNEKCGMKGRTKNEKKRRRNEKREMRMGETTNLEK